jgi:predicted membrane protein
MESNLLAATALVFGTLAIYAQFDISRFSPTARTAYVTRGLLALTGCGMGMVSGSLFPHDPGQALLASISGFGVVHVPAACILLLKRAQHSRR